MPDAKSGRVHFLRHLAVPGGVAAEDTGNHFLLRLTRRSERCRSGSQISDAGLYERHGAKGRCRSVEGGWLFNDLKKEERSAIVLGKIALVYDDFEFTESSPCFYERHIR